uniref:hypothetical protein n=1 Tax=uncultured Draconibacterium sp. TaxID=1573823 RepID=UPI0032177BDA
MKKLVLIFAAVFLTAISANIFAQSTGTIPHVSSSHSYEVTLHSGNDYSWTVTKGDFSSSAGADILIYSDAGLTTSYTQGTATGDLNKIYIKWVNPTVSSATTYFVQVVETDATGCSNMKALAVQPKNAFEMDIVALSADYTVQAIGTDADYCAADVTITGWNKTDATNASDAQDFNYDYGVTYLYYRVEAKGIDYTSMGWKPSVQFNNTNVTGSTVTATWGTTAPSGSGPQAGYSAFNVNSSSAEQIVVPSNNQYIYIEIAVDNNDTNTSGNEGTSEQKLQLLLTGVDGNDNGVTQINGTVDTANDTASDNIKARPNTSGISTN